MYKLATSNCGYKRIYTETTMTIGIENADYNLHILLRESAKKQIAILM